MSETVVEIHQSVTTVPELFQLVGDAVCARWEELGRLDSKIHWNYGVEAEALIAENIPAMLAYKGIAIKAGKRSQTIRKAYYTYKAFTKEQREQYNLAPYSVFQHAATCKDPIKVLQHYIDHMTSVDEIEFNFPPVAENEALEKEFDETGFSRIFYGIAREAFGIDPFFKARIYECIKEIEKLFEMAERR